MAQKPNTGDQVRIALKELDYDDQFNGRVRVDANTVAKYLDAIDFLPPIRVWANPDFDAEKPLKRSTKTEPNGNMPFKVLDGVQRSHAYELAAKKSKQYETIPAIVESVGRDEAQTIGMTANLDSALPLTLEERDNCVMGFIQLHPEVGDREAARHLQLTHPTVIRIKRVDGLYRKSQRQMDEFAKKKIAAKMPDRSTLHGIAELVERYRVRVLDNVMVGGWTRKNVRDFRSAAGRKGFTDADAEKLLAQVIDGNMDTATLTIAEAFKMASRMVDELSAESVSFENAAQAAELSELLLGVANALDNAIEGLKRKVQHAEHRDHGVA